MSNSQKLQYIIDSIKEGFDCTESFNDKLNHLYLECTEYYKPDSTGKLPIRGLGE